MIYLKLFLAFLKIGAVSFGGGYGMISLVRETVIANEWLTDEQFMNFIAVSESTPGPIAINMATLVGSSQGGLLGSACATLGVVLPSFVIILCIIALVKNLLKFAGVQAFLGGVRPCVVGLIAATAMSMFLGTILQIKTFDSTPVFNFKGAIILAIIALISIIYKRIKKKKPSPIIMILISAGLGMLLYSI
ncbi:MAG: chromate transporter [Clostridiales bacterium]|nr:chromate transporter [Clostridiales bacterium]